MYTRCTTEIAACTTLYTLRLQSLCDSSTPRHGTKCRKAGTYGNLG